ncbi:glycosyltransferase family 2 protein [Desulfurispora thermophila]|uniref:glycosyltransferase family 2 protein n=1 Tax=Desulfurispora thermophila TaxID=265470 RepID=UPI00036B49A2|nr:glycosyltransferase [Desulfurispora thermophila]
MAKDKSVSVLIPAFNEAQFIAETVRAARQIPGVKQVVVVNDASTDGTAQLAAAAGAQVIDLPVNAGKGNALNAGCRTLQGELVLLLDGDLGATAVEAARLLTPLQQGQADLSIAVFPAVAGSGGFGLVKGLARLGIKALAGIEVQAPLSGQRALTRPALQCVLPFASGYGVEVAMTIKAARCGLRIIEVPVQMHHRYTGRDLKGFLHRGKQFLQVARTLVNCR